MEYTMLNTTIEVGEVYRNGQSLYLVQDIAEGYLAPALHLRRIKDGWELDAVGAALYSTPDGVQLLWDYSKHEHWTDGGTLAAAKMA